MSVNSKMTALADEIRELSGTSTTKSIDTMTSDVNTANTEITEQTDLIAQISSALEGKAGSGGASVETCNVVFSASFDAFATEVYYVDSAFELNTATFTVSPASIGSIDVPKGTIIKFNNWTNNSGAIGATLVHFANGEAVYYINQEDFCRFNFAL